LILQPRQRLAAQPFNLIVRKSGKTQHIVQHVDQHIEVFGQRFAIEADAMHACAHAQIRADVFQLAVDGVKIAVLCAAHQRAGGDRRQT
jgi:hypothetical protein